MFMFPLKKLARKELISRYPRTQITLGTTPVVPYHFNQVLRRAPELRENHWSPVNSPHKGQGRGALMLSLICA